MNEKILLTIDLSKIEKARIVERRYMDKTNNEVIEKNYEFEIVPMKVPKVIKDSPTWQIVKTHFVAEGQTKEERAAKKATKFMGSGRMFRSGDKEPIGYPTDDNQQPPF